MLETTGSEQPPVKPSWREQFRDDDEITMYLYIAGLIRTLRSNAVKVAVAQEMYRQLGHESQLPPKLHWYSKRPPLSCLNPKYSFGDIMSIVDVLVRDLPAEDWPNKIDMIRAWPALQELARHTPDRYKPPEYDLQVRTRGRGEQYMLGKLRTAYDESFPPGIRL